jgi:hypothetical protein
MRKSGDVAWVNVGYNRDGVAAFSTVTRPGDFFDVSLDGNVWTLSRTSSFDTKVLSRTKNVQDIINDLCVYLCTQKGKDRTEY